MVKGGEPHTRRQGSAVEGLKMLGFTNDHRPMILITWNRYLEQGVWNQGGATQLSWLCKYIYIYIYIYI